MFKLPQMLRGLGAVLVCAFHMSLAFNEPRFGISQAVLMAMEAARHRVEFFFALSGFIISYAHRGDIGHPGRLRRFALKRFVRIYPLYWIVTALVIAFLLVKGRMPAYGLEDAVSFATLVKLTATVPPIIPAWTLYHEILFYALFGLVIFRRRLGIVAFALWFLSILVFGEATGAARSEGFVGVIVNPINLCFFSGIAVYFVYRHLRTGLASVWLVLGFAAVVCAIVLLDEHADPLLFFMAIACGIFLLLAGGLGLEQGGHMRDIRWLSLLGSASYVIYLLHPLLLTATLKSFYLLGLVPVLGLPAIFIATLGVILAVSVGVHLAVERPMLDLLGKLFGLRKRIAPSARRPEAAAARSRPA